MKSEATMEHETPRQHNNRYARNSRGIMENGVFCWSMQKLYLENQLDAATV
jgi:hypothetical protein